MNKERETEVVPQRHHENDKINEKMERYIKLLEKKRNAIDKFLTENYSDFNHSDYTPEVMTFRYQWSGPLEKVHATTAHRLA